MTPESASAGDSAKNPAFFPSSLLVSDGAGSGRYAPSSPDDDSRKRPLPWTESNSDAVLPAASEGTSVAVPPGKVSRTSDSSSAPPADAPPSCVAFLRNLPIRVTEAEIRTLCEVFGSIAGIVILEVKHQAFVQMAELESAKSMVELYIGRPPLLRGRSIFFLYSRRAEISGETPSKVLIVTVTNLVYPITLDVIHQVFSRCGVISKIATFTKQGQYHALVEYAEMSAAAASRASLDSQNIYTGCCMMSVRYSQLQALQVNANTEHTRDYLGIGIPSLLPSASGGGAASSGSSGDSRDSTMSEGVIPTPSGPPMGYVSGSGRSSSSAASSASVSASGASCGCVLLVSNLNTEAVDHPNVLFLLFDMYGDVQRIKILFSKRDTAMVEFATTTQARNALQCLNRCPFFGKPLNIVPSRVAHIAGSQSGEPPGSLTQCYDAGSPLTCVYRPRITSALPSPSSILHVGRLPDDATDEVLQAAFGSHGSVEGIRRSPSHPHMALVKYRTVDEAVAALIRLQDQEIRPGYHVHVEFAKSSF